MSTPSSPVQMAVVSASISGELYRAGIIAKQLSLAAKNSRVLVLRAGSGAAGLKVISDYFAELAAKAIYLSERINQTALEISSMSLTRWHKQTLLEKIESVAPQSSSLNQTKAQVSHYLNQLLSRFHHAMYTLDEQLDEIHTHMQASDVVAVTFRLEAAQTGEHRALLESMADNINQHSEKIQRLICNSKTYLSQLK